MKLVSFDAFRTLSIDGIVIIKPEHMFRERAALENADWLLFPEYWQVNALSYGLKKKIFPSMATYHLGHNKIEMTRWLELISPSNIPLTLILSNTPYNQERILEVFDFPFVAKEVKSARGQGVYLISDPTDFRIYCSKVETLYIQERLQIDRDLRLVVIGEKVVGGYWRVARENGFHNNISMGGEMMRGPIPDAAVTLVERLAKQGNINHAGFDVAMVNGHPYIFEFNRLFGNHGVTELGLDLGKLILLYLIEQSTPPNDSPLNNSPITALSA